MTLRELLTETGFDPMVPFIRKSECADNVCYFKLEYDILLHTSPNEEGYEYVAVSIYKSPEGKIYYNAPQLEGCLWSAYIDGQVIFKEDFFAVKVCDDASVSLGQVADSILVQVVKVLVGHKYEVSLWQKGVVGGRLQGCHRIHLNFLSVKHDSHTAMLDGIYLNLLPDGALKVSFSNSFAHAVLVITSAINIVLIHFMAQS